MQWAIPQTRDEGSMLIQVRAFLVAHTRGVAATNVRIQNMQICHSLGCKQIDISTADQFTATLRSNAAVPLYTFQSNSATLK